MKMKAAVILLAVLPWLHFASGQTKTVDGMNPKEIVDELWRLAAQGQLLTPQGWERAAKLFTEPTRFSAPQSIVVVANEWGPANAFNMKDRAAEADVGFTSLGTIDPALHFTPARTRAQKEVVHYELVAVPEYTMMYGPDGKTLISRRPTGTSTWQIKGSQGHAFTTANTAIRYVMNQREKTHDPVVKKNADQTLRILNRAE